MLDKLEKFFMPLAEKIGRNKYLIAIRDGFLLSMPLLIVGSFFLLIANFPIPGWTEFWARFFGDNWASYFSKPTDATFSIMAVLAVSGYGLMLVSLPVPGNGMGKFGLLTEEQKLAEISGIIFGTTGGKYVGVQAGQSTGLLITMTVAPCVLMLLSYYLYKKKYKLDEEEYDRICRELGKV